MRNIKMLLFLMMMMMMMIIIIIIIICKTHLVHFLIFLHTSIPHPSQSQSSLYIHHSTFPTLPSLSPHSTVTNLHSPPFPVSVHTLQSPVYIPHPSQSQSSLYSHHSTFPTLPSLSPHSTVTSLHSPPFPLSVLTLQSPIYTSSSPSPVPSCYCPADGCAATVDV